MDNGRRETPPLADRPLVSILIPCHNAARWVGEAVASAFAQSWPNVEVIAVDDGSTDGSLDALREFEPRGLRVETGPNRGGNAARNRLLELARGQWLQYLDADDYLLPDKLERQMDFLSGQPETDVVYGPSLFEYTDPDGAKPPRRREQNIPHPADPWVLLARWFLPQTNAPLWRREAIESVGGWKPDQPCCQEHELYFRLLAAGKRFAYCPHAGSIYRQWSEETVCRKDPARTRRVRLGILDDIEEHLSRADELTAPRRQAVNVARFEIARHCWQHDKDAAVDLMRRILQSDPAFQPEGPAAPRLYRTLFRLAGFSAAERVAAMKRAIAG